MEARAPADSALQDRNRGRANLRDLVDRPLQASQEPPRSTRRSFSRCCRKGEP